MEAKMNMGQQKPDLFKLSKFMNIADEAVMTEAETVIFFCSLILIHVV